MVELVGPDHVHSDLVGAETVFADAAREFHDAGQGSTWSSTASAPWSRLVRDLLWGSGVSGSRTSLGRSQSRSAS